jgi:hypothetical protein
MKIVSSTRLVTAALPSCLGGAREREPEYVDEPRWGAEMLARTSTAQLGPPPPPPGTRLGAPSSVAAEESAARFHTSELDRTFTAGSRVVEVAGRLQLPTFEAHRAFIAAELARGGSFLEQFRVWA